MKRFINGIIFVIFIYSSFLVGCSNKVSEDKIENNNKLRVEKSTNESNIALKKDMYLEKLDQLEGFKEWDNMLNEVYSILEEDLSKENMDKLREEEKEWINIKEIKSKEAADKYKGGTIEPFMALSSLVDSTKRRCYQLVNEYMN